jgi:hypothetical protein
MTGGTSEKRAAWFLVRAFSKSVASGVARPKPFGDFSSRSSSKDGASALANTVGVAVMV